MDSKVSNLKSTNLLFFLAFLQLVLYSVVFFDILVARQIIGFLYFTFVPGFIFIKLLKLDELNVLETTVFSVGFSVAFLMIAGLFINEFASFITSKPLSLMPLMVVLNGLIFFGGVLVCSRSENVRLLRIESVRLFPLALLFIGLPILSIIGATWVNVCGSNLILLLMIVMISVSFIVGIISKKRFPPTLYSLAILVIAISLLFHSSLISNYLVSFGSDNQREYFLFKVTENNAHWSSATDWGELGYGRLNSMLSITILPTIYSILLDINATWVLKMLYPLIFSFVPLGLYQLWQKDFGKKKAFVATFLFMAQTTFYTEMLGLCRQMIAELFFVLLLLVILSKEMKPFNKILSFMIFSFGLITSHYGLAEIFFLFILLVCAVLVTLKRPSRNVTVTMVVFFLVIMFSWYVYTSNSAVFDSLMSFGSNVYNQFNQFFNPASREQTVLRGLGLESPPTTWNMFSRVFAYITEFFIVLGFVALITKKLNIRLEREAFIFSLISLAFLIALIAVPGLASTMNMTRFYHTLLFFLAPLCVLGAEFLVKLTFKKKTELKTSILLLSVLVPYFLFQTGFVYEFTGTQSWSLPLGKKRMGDVFVYHHTGYFYESDVFGALWMSKNVDVENSKTYADAPSLYRVLTSHGMIYRGNMEVLSNITVLSANDNVYLTRANVVDDVFIGSQLWNTSSISDVLDSLNKVYSNGGCEIYSK